MVKVDWIGLDARVAGKPDAKKREGCARLVHMTMNGRLNHADALELRLRITNWTNPNPDAVSRELPVGGCEWFWLLIGHTVVHEARWGGPKLFGPAVTALKNVCMPRELGWGRLIGSMAFQHFARGFLRAVPASCDCEALGTVLVERLRTAIGIFQNLSAEWIKDAWAQVVQQESRMAAAMSEKALVMMLSRVLAVATTLRWHARPPISNDIFTAMLSVGAASTWGHTRWHEARAREFAELCIEKVDTGALCGMSLIGIGKCVLHTVLNAAICHVQHGLPDCASKCAVERHENGAAWLYGLFTTVVSRLDPAHWALLRCSWCSQGAIHPIIGPPAPIVRLSLAFGQYRQHDGLQRAIATACTLAVERHKSSNPKMYGPRLLALQRQGPRVALRISYNQMCPLLDVLGPGRLKAEHVHQILYEFEISQPNLILGPPFATLTSESERLAELARVIGNIVAIAAGPGIILYSPLKVGEVPAPRFGSVEACRVAMAARLLLSPGDWNVTISVFNHKFPKWNIVPVARLVLESARPDELAWWQCNKASLRQGPRTQQQAAVLQGAMRRGELVSPPNVYGLAAVPNWWSRENTHRWIWRFGGRSFTKWAWALMLSFEAQRRERPELECVPGQKRKREGLERCALPIELVWLVLEFATAQQHTQRDRYGRPMIAGS